jgi:hypothetical protein
MSAKRDSQPTSTEPTFYPVTKTLLSPILKEGRLPFEVRVNTSETKGKAHDMPTSSLVTTRCSSGSMAR